MAKQSSVNLDITNNADGFDISGGTTARRLGITGGDVTIAGSGSAVVTFPTTSTTIAGLGITQSFSALQSFSAGISASGGVTLAGTLRGTTSSFTGLVSSTVGFSGPGTNITGVVTSFNNQTGAVTGVTVGGTNVFTALNTFNAGLSGDINISTTNAQGNVMYLLMARGTGVTGVFIDNVSTPLIYNPFQGNLGLKGITLSSGADSLSILPGSVTANNSTNNAYFYFIANGGNYFQSPVLSQIGDIGGVNSAMTLNVDPSIRVMTWGDGVLYTGVTSGFFGVNRSPAGMLSDYAVEINSPAGKGIQLMYNDYTGAVSNSVKMDVSSTGNYTVLPSGGLATITGTLNVSAGISAAGATFSGDIAVNGGDITTTSATATLYNTTATTVNIGNAASTVGVMGATAGARLNIGSNSYVKTGSKNTTTTTKQEIFSYIAVAPFNADTYFADIIITANYGGGIAGSISSQITKMLVATSYNTAINHTEYGNVNTAGNLAVYTAEISGDNVIIYATPTSSSASFSTLFNTYATLIKGTYGADTEE
jgi:hypothetical protein